MKQTLKTCFRIILLSSLALLYAAQAFAVRPFLADDAETVKPLSGVVEFRGLYNADEATPGGIKTETSSNELEMKAVTGLCKHIDLSIIASGVVNERVKEDGVLRDRRDGWNDLIVESKYNFFEHDGFLLTVKPTILIPIGTFTRGLSDGEWGAGGTLIASKTFAEKYTLIANASYLRHNYRDAVMKDELRPDIWSGVLAAEAEVMHGLKVNTDFSVSTNQEKATGDVVSYALAGAEYEFCRNFSAFAAGKFGLNRPSIDMAALYGVSIKF
jgi:hypothetical protein